MGKDMTYFLKRYFNNKLYNNKVIIQTLEDLSFEDISYKNEELPRFGLTTSDYEIDYFCVWLGDDKIKDKNYLYLKNSAFCYYKNDDLIYQYETEYIEEILSIIKSNNLIKKGN